MSSDTTKPEPTPSYVLTITADSLGYMLSLLREYEELAATHQLTPGSMQQLIMLAQNAQGAILSVVAKLPSMVIDLPVPGPPALDKPHRDAQGHYPGCYVVGCRITQCKDGK